LRLNCLTEEQCVNAILLQMESFLFTFRLNSGMNLLSTIKKQNQYGFRIVILVLLFLYTVGISQFDGWHKLFHPHDTVISHSEAQEEDSCHRAVFHLDIEKGCEHRTHIVVNNKCDLCDSIFHTDHLLLSKLDASEISFESFRFIINPSGIAIRIELILSTRGPPALA
jgi:hypothetical protein